MICHFRYEPTLSNPLAPCYPPSPRAFLGSINHRNIVATYAVDVQPLGAVTTPVLANPNARNSTLSNLLVRVPGCHGSVRELVAKNNHGSNIVLIQCAVPLHGCRIGGYTSCKSTATEAHCAKLCSRDICRPTPGLTWCVWGYRHRVPPLPAPPLLLSRTLRRVRNAYDVRCWAETWFWLWEKARPAGFSNSLPCPVAACPYCSG